MSVKAAPRRIKPVASSPKKLMPEPLQAVQRRFADTGRWLPHPAHFRHLVQFLYALLTVPVPSQLGHVFVERWS
jgi:hypothetical protein